MKRTRSHAAGAPRRSTVTRLRSLLEETEPVLQIESTLTFFVLAVLLVPVGLVLLVVSAVLYVGLTSVIGQPTGMLATVVGLAWLGLTIGALFLTFRMLFRRLPGRVRRHAVPGLRNTDPDPSSPASTGDLAEGADSMASPSLAELDARLAPKAPPN